MKRGLIIVDRDIPFLAGVLENWFDVQYLPGREIGPDAVRNAVAFLIRTRTRCNASLLDGSSVRLIATATIGTDHIDLDYCAVRGIAVASAPGCNSAAVAQYVSTALRALALDRPGATLGVIGAGHVGTKVDARARAVGMRVLLSDPPGCPDLASQTIRTMSRRIWDAVRVNSCTVDILLGIKIVSNIQS